ncbi:O-methyltransferase [Acrasis kona]|uniref:O-methyltransferase n=1 Tax=Acrasis kona TaxID=1008807 RepID=A0AAW2YHY5_9EUKA
MVLDVINDLLGKKIILASESPRRKQILTENMGIKNIVCIPSNFDEESLDKKAFAFPCDFVVKNAECKALSVFNTLKERSENFDLIISADTIVNLGDRILEKPKDKEDAKSILRFLSGNEHFVYTGVSIVTKDANNNPSISNFYEGTKVKFSDLSDEFIDAYINTGEPMDKAGAYGIQGRGGMMVEYIVGCYFNVMGMPLSKLSRELRNHQVVKNKK